MKGLAPADWLCVFVAVVIVSYIMYLHAYQQPCYLAKLKSRGKQTEAQIFAGFSEPNATIIYRFHVNGIEYKGSYPASQNPPKRNDTISIVYLPEDPEISAVPGRLNGWLANMWGKVCK